MLQTVKGIYKNSKIEIPKNIGSTAPLMEKNINLIFVATVLIVKRSLRKNLKSRKKVRK